MMRALLHFLLSRRLSCAVLVLAPLACNGTEATAPTTGRIRVGVSTSGAELDPDGYTVAVQDTGSGGSGYRLEPVTLNGTVTFSDVSPGGYSLSLGGSAANCPVVGENPRVVTVRAGETAQITFQISCVHRIDVGGVWNYTEQFGSPFACNDTGSYVFTPSGDAFGGTNDQVGTCDEQGGSIDNSLSGGIGDGAVQYASSGDPHMSFSAGSCSISAEVSGTPPARLINGSITCPSGAGTWEAVRGGGAIGSVAVSPLTRSVVAGGTAQLRAVMLDASGSRRVGPTVTWTSDPTGVATVDAGGLVAGVASGSATITAAAETKSGTATVDVQIVSFATVQAGAYHSCGLAATGAYCWGHGTYGEMGNGAKAGGLAPVAVSDGANLVAVSVGAVHSCGLTASGAAYCWGSDYYGELGGGTPGAQLCGFENAACSTTPRAVAGGHTFTSVSAGWTLSCALTSSGSAYCWGDNTYGAMGNGSTASTRTPVQVNGVTFTSIGTGTVFACGLTAAGAAYCWGNNSAGQLGIGPTSPAVCNSEPCSTAPVAVSGGLTFTALSVGYWHACGLTSTGAAYCWGDNDGGQLGAVSPETCTGLGSTIGCSTAPLLVASNVSFAQLSAGSFHSCGLTTGGDGYCWGANDNGELGNGTTDFTPSPAPMAGGLSFAAVSAFGRWHSCGLSGAGVAYCWGFNSWGQVGNGAPFAQYQPVQVLGQAAVAGTAGLRAARVHRALGRAASRSPSVRPPAP